MLSILNLCGKNWPKLDFFKHVLFLAKFCCKNYYFVYSKSGNSKICGHVFKNYHAIIM